MSAVQDIYGMNEIVETTTQWLWYPFVPFGKVTIIMGDPGEGKTTLALNIASALSSGRAFWQEEPIESGDVLFQTAEDGLADTIKPRLMASGADCEKIFFLNEKEVPLSFTDERLIEAIQFLGAKLVILDPIQAFLGAGVDMHRANEIRPIMSHLSDIAARFGCAILLIGHMNKNMNTKAAYRAVGSIDLTAAARSVLIVQRDKSSPETRVISQIKSSLAPEGANVAFRLSENNGFEYIGEYESDIDELLLGIGTDRAKSELARELLMSELGGGNSVPAKVLIDKASQMGISATALRRAKASLNVRTEKKGEGWSWKM